MLVGARTPAVVSSRKMRCRKSYRDRCPGGAPVGNEAAMAAYDGPPGGGPLRCRDVAPLPGVTLRAIREQTYTFRVRLLRKYSEPLRNMQERGADSAHLVSTGARPDRRRASLAGRRCDVLSAEAGFVSGCRACAVGSWSGCGQRVRTRFVSAQMESEPVRSKAG